MSHAILSPSAAHRWLECTPSARLEERFPDTTSEAAREGTLAHALAEIRLRYRNGEISSAEHQNRFNILAKDALYSPEMEEHVDSYVAYVMESFETAKQLTPDAALIVEKQVDLTSFIPEGFGTMDAIIIADSTMHTVDLKYGKGVKVSAIENKQMSIYSLGALEEFSHLYKIDRVEMAIFQPRLQGLSTWNVTVDYLYEWKQKELVPSAIMAFEGTGNLVVGDHCRFCRAKAVCAAQKQQADQVLRHEFADSYLISDNELTEVLNLSDQIMEWLSAVRDYALQQALNGKEWPGYKLVEGRSIRQYADQDQVVEKLTTNGWDEALLFEKKLLGITSMEKLLGKKTFNTILADLVIKPEGKPTLAPESDKREPIKSIQIQRDFSNTNN